MAGTIQLDKVTEHPDGRFELVMTINGGGGQGRIWSTKADALAELSSRMDPEDMLVMFLLGYWQGRSADLTNSSTVLRKLLTVDFSSPQPIKVN